MGSMVFTKLATSRKSKQSSLYILTYRAQDYFSGQIMRYGQKLCDVYGNYLGFIDFDGKRYWDVREQHLHPVSGIDLNKCLHSDSRLRKDSQALKAGEVE